MHDLHIFSFGPRPKISTHGLTDLLYPKMSPASFAVCCPKTIGLLSSIVLVPLQLRFIRRRLRIASGTTLRTLNQKFIGAEVLKYKAIAIASKIARQQSGDDH
jgi:hypothetical protein